MHYAVEEKRRDLTPRKMGQGFFGHKRQIMAGNRVCDFLRKEIMPQMWHDPMLDVKMCIPTGLTFFSLPGLVRLAPYWSDGCARSHIQDSYVSKDQGCPRLFGLGTGFRVGTPRFMGRRLFRDGCRSTALGASWWLSATGWYCGGLSSSTGFRETFMVLCERLTGDVGGDPE